MRDGVSLNDQNKIKPVVTPTDLMSLENFEAYLKLPSNLPVAKITFGVPSMKLICPAFVPIADDTPPEEAGESGLSEQNALEELNTPGKTEEPILTDPATTGS
jgi:hypothetical protein